MWETLITGVFLAGLCKDEASAAVPGLTWPQNASEIS